MAFISALSIKSGFGAGATYTTPPGGVVGVVTTVWANRGLRAGAWKGVGLHPRAAFEMGTVIMFSS
jgi:hypothetical protein